MLSVEMKGHRKNNETAAFGVSVGRGKKKEATTGAKNETFDLCSRSHRVSLRLHPEIEKTGVKKKKVLVHGSRLHRGFVGSCHFKDIFNIE